MLKTWSISHAQALSEYRYSPEIGVVVGPSGRPIGHDRHKHGLDSRCKVVVDRKGEGVLPIARLIWFLVSGAWPETVVDHVNGDPRDQRWSNLRLATVGQNNCNSAQPLGASGYRNVVRGAKGKRWRVEFCRRTKAQPNKKVRSRHFDTPEEAAAEAERMRARLHGEFASTRAR